MSRKPAYNSDHTRRVISAANGKWLYQAYRPLLVNKEIVRSKTYDPWDTESTHSDKVEAIRRLGS